MTDFLIHWLVPAIVALVPAAWGLLHGLAMARHPDDPALAERLQAGRQTVTFVSAVVITVLLSVWRSQAWWALPLLLVSVLAAGWPLRRALFEETWSLRSYVSFYVRLSLAIYGFWILLIAAPAIVVTSAWPWTTAAVVGAVLLSWNMHAATWLRFLLRSAPLATAALIDRFGAVLAGTAIAAPRVEVVEMRGGVFINAFALPDTKQATVLFTSSLLERLDADEIAAIFAHEVAHLEHLNPAYVKRLRWAAWPLILAAAAIGAFVRAAAPAAAWALWLWPLVVVIYIAAIGQRRQKHETESDLRAAELTGDREAVIRGLVKTHALMKLPRRLDPNVEVNASHPSLARRIQALRAAAGDAPAALTDAVRLQSGTTAVTLHHDRLVWSEGDITSHTLAYSSLDELRIDVDAKGAARLVASDPQGRRWAMPVAPDDIPRAQAALDVVDTRLRPEPARRAVPGGIGRLIATLAALLALGAMQLAAAVVAILAGFVFQTPVVRAAGIAALAGGFLSLQNGNSREMAIMLILAAALLLFLSWRERRGAVTPGAWRAIAAIGVLALLTAVPIALAGADLFEAHKAARAWPGAIIFALAFAAAAVPRATLQWRIATLAAIVAAGVLTVTSATQTLDALVDDPFLQEAAVLAAQRLPPATGHFTVPIAASEVLLSPSGVATAAVAHDVALRKAAVRAGVLGGTLHTFTGNGALFVDDRRLLVNELGSKGSVLHLVDVESGLRLWYVVHTLVNVVMSIDRQGTTWQAIGVGANRVFGRIRGDLAGNIIDRREWDVQSTGEESVELPISSSGDLLLVSSMQFVMPGRATAWMGPWVYWLQPWRGETRLVVFDSQGSRELVRSKLEVTCVPSSLTDDPPVCEGFDGSRTHVASLTLFDGTLTPIARFSRRIVLDSARGWVSGRRAGRPFALDPSTRTLFEGDSELLFTTAERALGTVRTNGATTTIGVYPVPSVK